MRGLHRTAGKGTGSGHRLSADDPNDLPRCTAADVALVLRVLASEPYRIVLSHPWDSHYQLITARWRRSWLCFRRGPGPVIVRDAILPGRDGPVEWSYGCERNNWLAGPDSSLTEPIALLSAGEQQQLLEALAAAGITDRELITIPFFNGATVREPEPPPAVKRRRTKKPQGSTAPEA